MSDVSEIGGSKAHIPPRIRKVVALVVDTLSGSEEPWAFTGSTAFALQGVPVRPRDVDVQTTKRGAHLFEDAFRDFVLEPVAHRTSERIRSRLGRFLINDVIVEVMGDVEKRLTEDAWTPASELPSLTVAVRALGRDLPVLDLEYEIDAYTTLGRVDRARLLREWLAHGSSTDT